MQQDKKPRNEQKQRHGFWLCHSPSCNVFLQAYFINDEPHGYLYYRPLLRYNREIKEQHEYHAR